MELRFSSLLLILLLTLSSEGQKDSTFAGYKVKWAWETPLTVGLLAADFYGLEVIYDKPDYTVEEVLAFDPNNVNAFDRGATMVPTYSLDAANTWSDHFLNASFLLPAALMLDKRIRKDWAQNLFILVQTQAITGNVYAWGAAYWIERARPMVYINDIEMERRTDSRNKVSFYSGHVSTSAAATFFAAKSFMDYHPELHHKKPLVYGIASVLPLTVGYLRYRAAKHFPTDIIVGFATGAAIGIMVPHFHKPNKNGKEYGFIPQVGETWGLRAYYRY